MPYVDGFVIAVPKKNLDAFKKMAQMAGKVWIEHGALQVRECVADDVKPGEVVVFSWIVYKSRAARDKVNAKVMKDPRLASMMDPKNSPFDGKRMIFGGFETLVAFDA